MIEEGSNEWVEGMIDNEGWPYVIEMVAAYEIKENPLRAIWEEATDAYATLEKYKAEIGKLLPNAML